MNDTMLRQPQTLLNPIDLDLLPEEPEHYLDNHTIDEMMEIVRELYPDATLDDLLYALSLESIQYCDYRGYGAVDDKTLAVAQVAFFVILSLLLI